MILYYLQTHKQLILVITLKLKKLNFFANTLYHRDTVDCDPTPCIDFSEILDILVFKWIVFLLSGIYKKTGCFPQTVTKNITETFSSVFSRHILMFAHFT